MTPFHEKQDKILRWLRAKGYTGTPQDAMYKYAKDNSSITQGTFYDHLNSALWGAGYTGAILDDRLTQMFISKTGVTNRKDAERKFFNDSTLGMFSNGNDSFTELLLHMDGADASTTFTDSSSNATTVTRSGSAQIDTDQSKFGGASGLFATATSDYVSFPDSANFQVGSGPFTIDCWVRPTSVAGNEWWFGDLDVAGVQKSLMMSQNGGVLNVNLTFSDLSQANQAHQTAMSANTWYHVAVVSDGATITIYLDGIAGNSPQATSGKAIQANQSSGSWFIGKGGVFAGVYFGGHIDEFRFSKGIARWTSNFTPPTAAYS